MADVPAVPGRPKFGRRRALVIGSQLFVLLVWLISWQYVPQIGWLKGSNHVFDPFFISSPRAIFWTLVNLTTGRHGEVLLWPYLWNTVEATLIGIVIGLAAGAIAGLLLSSWRFASDVFYPFIVALNAVPRIALIPVIVLLVGITFNASLLISTTTVFFVAFFSAFQGGRSVAPELSHNARLLGAGSLGLMFHVRAPYVLAWTLSALPLAATYAVISVVTAELLTGFHGIGLLLTNAQAYSNASLTFALVFVLSAIGVIIVGVSQLFKRRILHWWEGGNA